MFEAELSLAVEAAHRGGAVLREGIGKIRDVRTVGYKGEVDLVTEYDRRSERLIVDAIRERFPAHSILAEEGTTGGADPAHRWIIDPLDGTTNFAHGYPICCVSVAYERDGAIVVGAVYDPFRDEQFSAVRGQGATLNRAPLQVSMTPDLGHALLATGFPYDRSTLDAVLERWGRLVRQSQAVRRDGAAALNLCYVGAGRFDGFWEATLAPWDAAAGVLIVQEAGGIVTDFQGKPWTVADRSIVAANGESMLGALLDTLK
jgi:myo-inositol-1(or 4)-monophosphatase